MITSTMNQRYCDVAAREVKSGMVREPQWSEALKQVGGDPDLAAKTYIFTRVAEIEEGERARESAMSRLKRLRLFNDSMAPFAPGKVLLMAFVALATMITVWLLMR